MRSSRENGGSRVTSCRANRHRSRTSFPMRYWPFSFDEESLEALSRDIVQHVRGVHARTRLLQRRVTDISAEDLNTGRWQAIAEIFQKGDGHGVGFLASRAPGHPDPERLFLDRPSQIAGKT